MKLTKERKILGGVLLAGAVALCVDRLTQGPKEAPAEDATSLVATATPSKSGNPKAPSKPSAPHHGLTGISEKLRVAANAEGTSHKQAVDLFQPSQKWLNASGNGSAPAGSPATAAERFRQAHRLTAVLMSGKSSRAIVDGKALSLGQVLDGFRLLSVDPRRAVLEGSGVQVVLVLEETNGKPVVQLDR